MLSTVTLILLCPTGQDAAAFSLAGISAAFPPARRERETRTECRGRSLRTHIKSFTYDEIVQFSLALLYRLLLGRVSYEIARIAIII